MDFLDIRDRHVQQFLWDFIVPSQLHPTYTKFDAIKFVYDEVVAGRQWLVGDMDARLVFRCQPINLHVLQPHIMGDPARLRTLLPSALDIAWSKGIRKVEVWTHLKAIADILKRMDWTSEAHFTDHFWDGEALHDIYVMGLKKP